MTDVTDLGEIVVTGQRRQPNGGFPVAGGGGGGGGGDTGAPQQNEVSPNDPLPPETFNPCANVATALPWNADAAAARAVPAYLAAAASLGFADAPNGSPRLSNREFARGLSRGPNGTVNGGAISWGPPIPPGETGTVDVDVTGIDAFNYLGDAHSHPGGNPLPSVGDWAGFMSNNRAARTAGRTSEYFYTYIFAVNSDGVTGTTYVYRDGPRAANSADPPKPTTVGAEVNPDAQPCP